MSKNEGTSQEISVREVEKIGSKFSKAWFFLSDGDRTGIYNRVQNAVRQVNLSDERQLRIIKIVRAIYQANVASRSIGHTVSLGLLATVIALFCSVASVVDGGAKLYFLVSSFQL